MNFKQFLRVSRPPTLLATIVPLLIGGAMGWITHHFQWWAWLDMVVIAFSMQIGVNMLNEYFDYRRGLDDHESLGIGGIIVTGEVKPRTVWHAGLLTYALALILGLILVYYRGPLLLVMGLLGIIAGFLYTSGPYPISSTPFGELLVALIMGPIEVLATQFASAGVITPVAELISWPVGISVATILIANNLRDLEKDRRHGRHTLPIVFGAKRGLLILISMIAIVLLWITVMAFTGLLPYSVLIIWLSLPVIIANLKKLSSGQAWGKAVPITGRIHVIIGVLLAIGILW
ncbi:MAG: 1,4-dihydroxy-2-naphthoate octaprenyltransferase [Sulfobacillus thermotolerans]|uniref:1,4-dihydroxy-2-naphthoate octaprenyltransferase n=1 Tax=Sulfobacillus thermotolerans TaxID=338644 RepID=A0ABN5H0F7_9FIRM|nr:1,4-dihydroxy-2-naphthoate octaprenyltransferase [Sulfobacillus thermotolerans]MCY0907575.1 1,4-dihydroxy-2-naphthoate octaprenyltransferase [Sulfobacillus thermotolerans]